ncbi:putative ribonuclease H protein At1g65750 [Spinacia oleracea]|uniref:Ribonuclease H protein At1g65750 n=1 Tax=Spinacia oleracea TaxID=3562 RepID=A0A9R0IAH9_SPIOL|nr:putative ribonuclease H protein At1g65750 [Spinacia oleracea]
MITNVSSRRLSWGMRGIFRASNLLFKGCDWKIGNGKKVWAGKDRWVNGRVPEFKSNVTLLNAATWKVNHFILPNGSGWNLNRVHSCFEFNDAREIVATELPSTSVEDFLYWRFHKSGKFTVKTTYAMLAVEDYGLAQAHPGLDFFKILWALKILPKWKVFLWKLFHNGIASKVNVGKKGVQLSLTCDFCAKDNEDIQHIFRFCDCAKRVWRYGSLAIHSEINENLSFIDWVLYFIRLFQCQDGKNSVRVIYFIATLWGLWLSRNNRIFRNERGEVLAVYIIIREEIQGIMSFIQVDGSWKKNTRIAGMGWVLSNPLITSDRILGGASVGTAKSALQAEVLACLFALRWSITATVRHITVLTDSHMLVEMLLQQSTIDINLLWTITEIKRLGRMFDWCSIQKVGRDQVQGAHDIATSAAATSISFAFFP